VPAGQRWPAFRQALIPATAARLTTPAAAVGLLFMAPLFCENETNLTRLYGAVPITPYPKDGIDEHVIHGAATVNPISAVPSAGSGTS
jgi:hypothetical protein